MSLRYARRSLSSTAREALYDRCRGENAFPTCNICGLPVDGTREAWDESHDPDGPPHALNGNSDTGIAHRDCNRRHGAEVVVPLMAKVKRNRQKNIGAFRTRTPMACGRASRLSKSMGGGVKPRLTLAERDRASTKIIRRAPRNAPCDPLDHLDAQLAVVAQQTAQVQP